MDIKETLKEAVISTITYPNKTPEHRVVLDADMYNQAITELDRECVWVYDAKHQRWTTKCGDVVNEEWRSVDDDNLNNCPNCGLKIKAEK